MKLLESEAIFFDGPREFYDWLEAHHESEDEVLVGMYKKHTGKQTMTWSQAVDQALCFGWIDGVMRRIDDERHVQRFTPRRPGSNWSKVNVEKMARLEAEGLVAEAGRRAFEARTDARTGVYSFEEGQDATALGGVRGAPARERRGCRVLGRHGRPGTAERRATGSRAPSARRRASVASPS